MNFKYRPGWQRNASVLNGQCKCAHNDNVHGGRRRSRTQSFVRVYSAYNSPVRATNRDHIFPNRRCGHLRCRNVVWGISRRDDMNHFGCDGGSGVAVLWLLYGISTFLQHHQQHDHRHYKSQRQQLGIEMRQHTAKAVRPAKSTGCWVLTARVFIIIVQASAAPQRHRDVSADISLLLMVRWNKHIIIPRASMRRCCQTGPSFRKGSKSRTLLVKVHLSDRQPQLTAAILLSNLTSDVIRARQHVTQHRTRIVSL